MSIHANDKAGAKLIPSMLAQRELFYLFWSFVYERYSRVYPSA